MISSRPQASRPSTPQAAPAGSSEAERFDEAYYLRHNPDVAAAIAEGRLQSGWEHFASHGRFEQRSWRCRAQLAGIALGDVIQAWRDRRYGATDAKP